MFDDGTWILTRASKSHFSWDHGKHERHFQHGESLLPELWLHNGTSYYKAFCMRMKGYLDDTVHYAFSSAFTMSPTVSANEGDRPEASVVSDDEDSEEEEDQSLQEDTSFWYKPKNIEKPKIVTFTKDTKAPASEPQKTTDIL